MMIFENDHFPKKIIFSESPATAGGHTLTRKWSCWKLSFSTMIIFKNAWFSESPDTAGGSHPHSKKIIILGNNNFWKWSFAGGLTEPLVQVERGLSDSVHLTESLSPAVRGKHSFSPRSKIQSALVTSADLWTEPFSPSPTPAKKYIQSSVQNSVLSPKTSVCTND